MDKNEPGVASPPMLTPVRWAELLLEQLPVDHEGRNNWLRSHGTRPASRRLREQWSKEQDRPYPSEVE